MKIRNHPATRPVAVPVATKDDWIVYESSWHNTCPFKTSPDTYVEYAQQDLADRSERGNLNAFHNAKRSIDCQMDYILWNFGLATKGFSTPQKLHLLNDIGAGAPRILQRLIKRRNLLEHEYEAHDREACEDAVDIATLFIQATDPIATIRYSDWEFWSPRAKIGGSFSFGYDSPTDEEMKRGYRRSSYSRNYPSKAPCGVFFELFRSSRSDDDNPREMCFDIQRRNAKEIDEQSESDRLRTREAPTQSLLKILTAEEIEIEAGYVPVGFGWTTANEQLEYSAFVRMMVRGIIAPS